MVPNNMHTLCHHLKVSAFLYPEVGCIYTIAQIYTYDFVCIQVIISHHCSRYVCVFYTCGTLQVLAKKMTVLYKLAKGQLSRQYHYDFGLRALKAVLVMAGELKRGSPELHEDMVLMRALRDMNLPKFVFEDVPLFLGLIGDLFPGLDCPRVRYPKFNDAVEAILMENKYILLPNQVRFISSCSHNMLLKRKHEEGN